MKVSKDNKVEMLLVRIPSELKKEIKKYCDERGLKMCFFVVKAVQEKLEELKEDTTDILIATERLKGEFVSEDAYYKYLKKRKINV